MQERRPTEHSFWYLELRYRRNALLLQDKHGVNMSFENRQAYTMDEKRRNATGADGFSRTQLNFNYVFNTRWSFDFNMINFINYRNTSSKQSPDIPFRAQYFNRLVFAPNFKISERMDTSLGFFYDSGHTTSRFATSRKRNQTDDFVWINPSFSYKYNNALTLVLDHGWGIYRSHDGRNGFGTEAFYSKANNIHQWGYWYGLTFNFNVF